MKITDLPSTQAQRYITTLQRFAPHRQLLVKVGGGLLQDNAAMLDLTEALAELAGCDIHAVLAHGGGPQLGKAISRQQGGESRFVGGRRYTNAPTLKLAQATFEGLSANLVQAFEAAGVSATTLPAAQLFSAKRDPALGLAGSEITATKKQPIIAALKAHSILVLHSLARDEATGETLNVNADTVFRALASRLQPHRMTSLTPTGGVLKSLDGNNSQELIGGIDVRNVETLIAEGVVSGGMALKLRELAAVLDTLEVGSAISITKPSDLLGELLTDRGTGTFVSKGEKIITTSDIGEVLPELSTVVREAFGKSLPADYARRPVERIYFTPDRLAFGVVAKLRNGTPYLDKLAVSPQLQGRGIGESLWYRITADYPAIVWRSHAANRYATWYHRHADVMQRRGEWLLFGYGVGFAQLEALAGELVAIPAMESDM